MNIRIAAAIAVTVLIAFVIDLKYRTCAGELTCFLVSIL